MGNRNNTVTKKNLQTTIKPARPTKPALPTKPAPIFIPRSPPPPATTDRTNNNSPTKPASSFIHRSPPPPAITDRTNNNSPTQPKSPLLQNEPVPSSPQHQQPIPTINNERISPIIMKRPVILVPTTEQSFSVLPQRSASPIAGKPQIPSAPYSTSIPTTNTVTASSLQRFPMLPLNYIAKSSDNKSINTYRHEKITIVHRTSLPQAASHGSRWYDHDYNDNINPMIVQHN